MNCIAWTIGSSPVGTLQAFRIVSTRSCPHLEASRRNGTSSSDLLRSVGIVSRSRALQICMAVAARARDRFDHSETARSAVLLLRCVRRASSIMARDCKLECACRTQSFDPPRSCFTKPCYGQPGWPAGSRTGQAWQAQQSRASKHSQQSRDRRALPEEQTQQSRASKAVAAR